MVREKFINFINVIEQFKIVFKNHHWSTLNMEEHELYDQLYSILNESQDTLVETWISIYGHEDSNLLVVNGVNKKLYNDSLNKLLDITYEFYDTIINNDYSKIDVSFHVEVESFIKKLVKINYLFKLV